MNPSEHQSTGKLFFWKRHVPDYRRDTGALSMLEHGAYTLLLDEYYLCGPLQADKPALFRIVRAMNNSERRAVEKVLAAFFDLRGNRYHHRRADTEIAEARRRQATAAANGRRGGRPTKGRRGNPEGNQGENPLANQTRNQNENREANHNIEQPQNSKELRSGEAIKASPTSATTLSDKNPIVTNEEGVAHVRLIRDRFFNGEG